MPNRTQHIHESIFECHINSKWNHLPHSIFDWCKYKICRIFCSPSCILFNFFVGVCAHTNCYIRWLLHFLFRIKLFNNAIFTSPFYSLPLPFILYLCLCLLTQSKINTLQKCSHPSSSRGSHLWSYHSYQHRIYSFPLVLWLPNAFCICRRWAFAF